MPPPLKRPQRRVNNRQQSISVTKPNNRVDSDTCNSGNRLLAFYLTACPNHMEQLGKPVQPCHEKLHRVPSKLTVLQKKNTILLTLLM